MNNLVAKAYQEMKKVQEENTVSEQSKFYPEDRAVKTSNLNYSQILSSVSLNFIQELQLLVVNLPFYKNTNPNLNVTAFEHVSQIQKFAKIHGDQLGLQLKLAVVSIFNFSELQKVYDAMKQSDNETIQSAYAKLHEHFSELNKRNFTFSYDILSMLCEYMAKDLENQITV